MSATRINRVAAHSSAGLSAGEFAPLEHAASLIGATRSVLVSRVTKDAGDARRLSCGVERLLTELSRLGR